MIIKFKRFNGLNINELYEILKLRNEVFIVEQECIYQDLDDIDKDSIHVLCIDDNKIIAYLRIIPKQYGDVYIGRVLSTKRRCGVASDMLRNAIDYIKDNLGADNIYVEAQLYVKELYEKLGFKVVSDVFKLDGIEHIKMVYKC